MNRLTSRENMLRTIFFQGPDYIPMTYAINGSCYFQYDLNDLFDLMERHPILFPDFVRPKDNAAFLEGLRTGMPGVGRAGEPFTDDFGCVWETPLMGLTGTVTKHPLADLSKFEQYRFPDPEVCMGIGPIDWKAEEARIAAAKAEGKFVGAGLRHGHTYLQLTDLCSYEGFLYAMMDEDPVLEPLIKGVNDFNCAIIQKYINMGVDLISIPEDLGMQSGPMITPEHFKKYIKPSYQRMMKMARDAGCIVHMHSDGDIRTLVDDIIDGGCQIINLQDLVNGIDWIAERFRGKTCVDLDIDRQNVTFGGTPKDIDDLIHEEVEKIGTPAGGLMMVYGLYPGTPIENADAVAAAMEKYRPLR